MHRVSLRAAVGGIALCLSSIGCGEILPPAQPAQVWPDGACSMAPKDVVLAFTEQLYIQKQVRPAFEQWAVPGYIQHNPEIKTGRDGVIAALEPFFASRPRITQERKRVIAEGDLVVLHGHSRNDPNDPGMAIVDIFRVQDCKVVEHWDVVQDVLAHSENANTMF